MHLRVDTATAVARLEEPEDFARLSVLIVGDGDADLPLRTFGGRIEGGHAWLEAEALKAAAAGRVPDTWLAGFEEMVAFAASRGWVSEDGRSLRAHVERVDAPPPEKKRLFRR